MQRFVLVFISIFVGLSCFNSLASEATYLAGGSKQCKSCHDYGKDSPVTPLLNSAHGKNGSNKHAPMKQTNGCESCHGPSAEHASAPTQTSPAISFGPRWTNTVDKQNSECIKCHQHDAAAHWKDALHKQKDLGCISCHDLHTEQDKMLQDAKLQAEVCTICHKEQKTGIHALVSHSANNPACESCHMPHADPHPNLMMVENRSEGCRHCHDLIAMQENPSVKAKAKSYHRTMVQLDRTCIDCHQGIAHADAHGVAAKTHTAVKRKHLTLFLPNASDMDWLVSEHPGAQAFRQGSNCQQCHRGEESSMAANLVPQEKQAGTRQIDIAFDREDNELVIQFSWTGSPEAVVSMMWGDDGNEAFQRSGCWAACHGDLPGMSLNRGQKMGKYLAVSRQQKKQIGRPTLLKDEDSLQQLMQAGNFVEQWDIGLDHGKVNSTQTSVILAEIKPSSDNPVSATADFSDGKWQLTIRRPLSATKNLKSFTADKHYTFGIAIHDAGRTGAAHWVSFPLTLSIDSDDTDFKLR